MSVAKFKCVREVSSEDAKLTADNLMKNDVGKKWTTKNIGEKFAYVIFELEKPARITGIDIGNQHSAFVGVSGSSSGCNSEDFMDILLTSSFMTPIESKNSSNPNRVRFFNNEALVASAAKEKFRFIKVLCSQPFNNQVQYGLSFIKIHIEKEEVIKGKNTPDHISIEKENGDKTTTLNNTKKFAKFSLREDSPESNSDTSATLFNRWKKSHENENLITTAAAIRQASTTPSLRRSIEGIKKTTESILHNSSTNDNQDLDIRDRNRVDLLFGDEEETNKDDKKLQCLLKHIESEKEQLKAKTDMKNKKENAQKSGKLDKTTKKDKHSSDIMQKENSLHQNTSSLVKKRNSSPIRLSPKRQKSEILIQYRPFNQLLEGVVLVISGIQNPDRANLRSKALAMGAKYKVNWEAGCTHLICAFKNTPKYNQVKGTGKIVERAWIEKCYELKKYLPWRRFALDNDEKTKPESDCEILDDTFEPKTKQNGLNQKNTSVENVDSESDTDDDIERIMEKNNGNGSASADRDIYDVTTEEEDYVQHKTKKAKKL